MAEKENIKDKLENLKEGHRKSNKDIIESLFAILGYLKNNTDVDNPTSQTSIYSHVFHSKSRRQRNQGLSPCLPFCCEMYFLCQDIRLFPPPCGENKLCERYILQSPIFKKRGHRSYKCRENVKGDRRG